MKWATRLGVIQCDDFIVNVWRPRRFLRWLFPGYWRFRLGLDSISAREIVLVWGVREMVRALSLYRRDGGLIDVSNFVGDEMPDSVGWSTDGGLTWNNLGTPQGSPVHTRPRTSRSTRPGQGRQACCHRQSRSALRRAERVAQTPCFCPASRGRTAPLT